MSTRSVCVALLVAVFSIPQRVRADTVANPLFTEVPYGAEALVAGVKARLNAQGYLGAALPAGVMDEQVLAGHSWLLRGLIEYHKHKRDQDSLQMIRGLVNNLLLPARAAYERYPTSDRIDRKQKKQTAPLWVPSRMVGGYQTTSVVRS